MPTRHYCPFDCTNPPLPILAPSTGQKRSATQILGGAGGLKPPAFPSGGGTEGWRTIIHAGSANNWQKNTPETEGWRIVFTQRNSTISIHINLTIQDFADCLRQGRQRKWLAQQQWLLGKLLMLGQTMLRIA